MRSLKRFLIPLAAMAGVLAFVAPASAAPGATINSVTNSGCTLLIDVTFADAGPYSMEIWDDGRRLDKQTITTDTADKNVTFQFVVVRPIRQSPPGLTVEFYDGSSNGLAEQAGIDFKGSENCSPPPLTLDPSATTEPPATTEVPTTGGPITEPPTTMAPPTTAAPTTVTPGGSVAPATGARPLSGKANYTG